MATEKTTGYFVRHIEQIRQGLFADDYVQRLFYQRKVVPLAKPKHNKRKIENRSEIYSSHEKQQQGFIVCSGI